MIEVKNISKCYEKGKDVLQKVNLRIEDGCVFGLVGINGAGKSTLLRLLSGVMRVDEGEVLIDGENVFENEYVKRNVFFLPDDPFYTSGVTAIGLAEMYRSVYDFDDNAFEEYLQKFTLDGKKPIRNFSKGMKRQVFVALAFAIAPKYLFLDEAFDGLDPLARMTFKRGLIRLVEEKNTTVIISSHSLRELEDICDGYGILDHGCITCSGDLESDLTKLHKFQAAFDRQVTAKEFGFDCMSFTQEGKVVRLIAKGDADELLQQIEALQPLFVEEIGVDFEELFIGEVESRGYLQ
ncbi:MAG: ABC transporter ATP-binding protein [Clostridia bacterium]|nr:ABC transporter ATP-binding protein [Clostridia bacterium]